ncbi:MAG: hypothetical protein QHH06_12535 [Clostridiales bacterium]|jgi:spore coat protein U-like protein|nr:hypothetical protein [Eubacteriales bacterium]MDH7567277.1 hypothetical protein [Clostridiales bacterium]
MFRKGKVISVVIVLVGVMLILSATVFGQSISFSIPGFHTMNMQADALSFGSITPGVAVSPTGNPKTTISVSANTTWHVYLSGTDFTNGSATIPISSLQFKVGNGSFNPVGNNNTPVINGTGSLTSPVSISYQLFVQNGIYPAGSYTSNLTYTITD